MSDEPKQRTGHPEAGAEPARENSRAPTISNDSAAGLAATRPKCRICARGEPAVCDDCEHKNQDLADAAGYERGIADPRPPEATPSRLARSIGQSMRVEGFDVSDEDVEARIPRPTQAVVCGALAVDDPVMPCLLDKGHAGMHRDENGVGWGGRYVEPCTTNPSPDKFPRLKRGISLDDGTFITTDEIDRLRKAAEPTTQIHREALGALKRLRSVARSAALEDEVEAEYQAVLRVILPCMAHEDRIKHLETKIREYLAYEGNRDDLAGALEACLDKPAPQFWGDVAHECIWCGETEGEALLRRHVCGGCAVILRNSEGPVDFKARRCSDYPRILGKVLDGETPVTCLNCGLSSDDPRGLACSSGAGPQHDWEERPGNRRHVPSCDSFDFDPEEQLGPDKPCNCQACDHPMHRRRGSPDSIWCAVCGSCWYDGTWHPADSSPTISCGLRRVVCELIDAIATPKGRDFRHAWEEACLRFGRFGDEPTLLAALRAEEREVCALIVERQASIRRMRAQSIADDSDRADGEAQSDDIAREESAADLLEYVAARVRQRPETAAPGKGEG